MSKPTIVTFLKSWRGYGVGETAGFEAERAEDLIKSDVAEAYKKGRKSGAKPDTPPPGKGSNPAPEKEQNENDDSDSETDEEKP